VQEPAQDVAAQLVGAEHMPFGERRRELVRHLDPDRIGQTQAPGETAPNPRRAMTSTLPTAGRWRMKRDRTGASLMPGAPRIDRGVDDIGEQVPYDDEHAVSINRPISTG